MFKNVKCPFCDSSEVNKRDDKAELRMWEEFNSFICSYFPNFRFKHYKKLCNSCLQYVWDFCKCKKNWLDKEKVIHSKRKLGQFKGLKDIVKPKKKSSLICRLCFKENPSEDVIFIYVDCELYQPGYIQKIISQHASDIDFNLTENPVICQECLDAVQTFDALYQMSVENQASKDTPDFKVGNQSDAPNKLNNEEIVHVQLKKNKDNSLVLKSVTEAESAVNSLIKNKESSSGNVILNGWTVKKVIDLIQKPKPEDIKNTEESSFNPEEIEQSYDDYYRNDDENKAIKILKGETTEPADFESHLESSRNSFIENNEQETNSTDEPVDNIESKEETSPDIIEICDSDDEEDELPRILSVETLNETVGKHLPSGLDDLEEGEIVPGMVINMEAVSQLFKNDQKDIELDPLIGNKSNLEPDFEVMSVEGTSVLHDCCPNSKEKLEENLSDFLQFNRSSLKRQPESPEKNYPLKRSKHSTIVSNGNQTVPKTYASAFQQFLLPTVDVNKGSAWKLLRGFLSKDSRDDEFCTWYPHFPRTKKQHPSKRASSYMTTLVNCSGFRLYRCNICLELMKEESEAQSHPCLIRGRKSYLCDYPFCNHNSFNIHLKAQHEQVHKILTSKEILKYKCSKCDFFSAHDKCLENHSKKKHGQVIVAGSFSKCSYCFFQSDKPEILAHHMSVRHKGIKKSRFTEKHFS